MPLVILDRPKYGRYLEVRPLYALKMWLDDDEVGTVVEIVNTKQRVVIRDNDVIQLHDDEELYYLRVIPEADATSVKLRRAGTNEWITVPAKSLGVELDGLQQWFARRRSTGKWRPAMTQFESNPAEKQYRTPLWRRTTRET